MTKVRSNIFAVFIAAISLASVAAGCNAPEEFSAGVNYSDADEVAPPDSIKDPTNPNLLVVAVKYVVLKGSASEADSTTREAIETALARISSVWAQCDIAYYLAKYEIALASDHGLDLTPSSFSALREVRQVYDDGAYALIARVNEFTNSSELGTSNAYSTMPGSEPEGIVVEKVSQTSHMLLAHELGHLVGGLGHTTGTNLMNHFVSPSNTPLTTSQCNTARDKLQSYHARWVR